MDDRIGLEELKAWLLFYADQIEAREGQLNELDAAIGDGDHGVNMVRGMRAVRSRLLDEGAQPIDVGELFRTVAMTLISSIGGAAGPLYGAFFLRASREAGVDSGVDVPVLARMFRAGVDGVRFRGKAELGEKTMLDVLDPAAGALEHSARMGAPVGQALVAARAAAQDGLAATIAMEAAKGRASYLGPRSIGHQDPGGTSSFYLVDALARTASAGGEASDL